MPPQKKPTPNYNLIKAHKNYVVYYMLGDYTWPWDPSWSGWYTQSYFDGERLQWLRTKIAQGPRKK